MACAIVSDANGAVLVCTTSNRALDCQMFGSRDEAEDFMDWLGYDPRDNDELAKHGFVDAPIDGSWYPALDHAINAWGKIAYDSETDQFVGAA